MLPVYCNIDTMFRCLCKSVAKEQYSGRYCLLVIWLVITWEDGTRWTFLINCNKTKDVWTLLRHCVASFRAILHFKFWNVLIKCITTAVWLESLKKYFNVPFAVGWLVIKQDTPNNGKTSNLLESWSLNRQELPAKLRYINYAYQERKIHSHFVEFIARDGEEGRSTFIQLIFR